MRRRANSSASNLGSVVADDDGDDANEAACGSRCAVRSEWKDCEVGSGGGGSYANSGGEATRDDGNSTCGALCGSAEPTTDESDGSRTSFVECELTLRASDCSRWCCSRAPP